MALTENYVLENIFLSDTYANDEAEVYNGVLCLEIESTWRLEKMADTIRVDRGKKPFFYGKDRDDEAWYSFFLSCRQDRFESFTVSPENAGGLDNEFYEIVLDDQEKECLYRRARDLVGEERWQELFSKAA